MKQLASQQEKERVLEEAAASFFLTRDALDQLSVEQDQAQQVFDERRKQLERDLGVTALTLRSLDTPAMIADLLGISGAELSRLIKQVKNDSAPENTEAKQSAATALGEGHEGHNIFDDVDSLGSPVGEPMTDEYTGV